VSGCEVGGVECKLPVSAHLWHGGKEPVVVDFHSTQELKVVDSMVSHRPKIFGSFGGPRTCSQHRRDTINDMNSGVGRK
jgi:hypothetical protein